MNFLNRLFSNNESFVDCPRCLGKGHVDVYDIKLLKQELRWLPGKCAYCNESGKVNRKTIDIIPADASYLVTNLPEAERQNILKGHRDAIKRGEAYVERVDTFIIQITFLHFKCGLTSGQIATFFLLGNEALNSYEKDKKSFIDYVEKVIDKKADKP